MALPRNLSLIIESSLYLACAGAISQYIVDVENEGWFVTQHLVQVTDSVTTIFGLCAGADHVQLFGNIARPLLFFDPDGHGTRDGECDAPYCAFSWDAWQYNGTHFNVYYWPDQVGAIRTCGRVDFSGLSDYTAVSEYTLFNTYMARNHAYRTGAYVYSTQAVLVNYLEYLDPGLTSTLTSRMEAVVGSGTVQDKTDQYVYEMFYRTYTPTKYTMGALYSGGDGFRPFGHEYNIGPGGRHNKLPGAYAPYDALLL
jgi:hypothetical protein